MKDNPYCPIDSYNVVEVFHEFLLFWMFWSDGLNHICMITQKFPIFKEKYVYLFFCWNPVVNYPDEFTLSDSNLFKLWFKHIFSVTNTCYELIEKFHDVFLAHSKILPSSVIDISPSIISSSKCASA